jgi:hypothetical protein
MSGCDDGSTDPDGGGGGPRPAKSDFYGTWDGLGAAEGYTSTTTETGWEEITNTNTDTKAEYPYGYKLYVSYTIPDLPTNYAYTINYMHTNKNKIGSALTTNPGYESMTYYTKQ